MSQPITKLNTDQCIMYSLEKALAGSLQLSFRLFSRKPHGRSAMEKCGGGAWRMSPPSKRRCTTSSQTTTSNAVHLQEPLTAPLACRTATFALRSVRMWHARPLPKRGSRFHASLCLLDTLGVCAKQVCTSLDRTCQETTLVSRLALGHGQMKKHHTEY